MDNLNSTRQSNENETPDLNDILGYLHDTECDKDIVTNSPYFSISDIDNIPLKDGSKFNILSVNIQSLNAKFESLVSFLSLLQDNAIHFSAICLQETWQSNDQDCQSKFSIPGYTLITKGKSCSEHGGLAIYLDTEYTFTKRDFNCNSPIWESLFIEVRSPCLSRPLTLGTIYRPPKFNNCNSTIDQFINELRPVICLLEKEKKYSGTVR